MLLQRRYSCGLARGESIYKPHQSCKYWLKFYLVYNVWLVVEASAIWFIWPETNGAILEEVVMGKSRTICFYHHD